MQLFACIVFTFPCTVISHKVALGLFDQSWDNLLCLFLFSLQYHCMFCCLSPRTASPRLFSSAVYSVLHLLVSFLPAFFILLVFPTLLALIKLLPLSCVFINTTFPLVEFLCLSLMGVNNYTSHCFVGSGWSSSFLLVSRVSKHAAWPSSIH